MNGNHEKEKSVKEEESVVLEVDSNSRGNLSSAGSNWATPGWSIREYVHDLLPQFTWRVGVFFLVLILSLNAIGLSTIFTTRQNQIDSRRLEAQSLATYYSAFFSKELQSALLPMYSLAAFITRVPALTDLSGIAQNFKLVPREDGKVYRNVSGIPQSTLNIFSGTCSDILQLTSLSPTMISLQLAPRGIITMTYPAAGNEGATGYDQLEDPTRAPDSLRTISSGEFTMSGPVLLVQGGYFLIGRLPLFVNVDVPGSMDTRKIAGVEREVVAGKNFWGFVTCLFNYPLLLNQSGILQELKSKGIIYNLTRLDVSYASGKAVQSVKVVSSSSSHPIGDGVTVTVQVPNNDWNLTISYVNGFAPRWVNPAIVAVVVCSFFLSCLMIFILLVYKKKRQFEIEGDSCLSEKMREIRRRLRLNKEDGFFLSHEAVPFWRMRESVVFLQRRHLEAAAQLALWRDFDINQVDALYACIVGEEQEQEQEQEQGEQEKVEEQQGKARKHRSHQYHAFRSWLLDVSTNLLQPDYDEAIEHLHEHEHEQDSTEEERQSHVSNTSSFASEATMRVSNCHERFEYFKVKVSKIRIWKDEKCALFRKLKGSVRAYMDELAGLCHYRFEQLVREVGGAELIKLERLKIFEMGPATIDEEGDEERNDAEVGREVIKFRRPSDILIPDQPTFPDLRGMFEGGLTEENWLQMAAVRQDTVGAIRPTSIDKAEREAESMSSVYLCRRVKASSWIPSSTNEDVFIHQLYRRATLLKEEFDKAVLAVIDQHCTFDGRKDFKKRARSYDKVAGHTFSMRRCKFEAAPGTLSVHFAAIKTINRMQAKLEKYKNIRPWPLSACILDPVRISIVCTSPAHVLEVMKWFQEGGQSSKLRVCRVKNKFAYDKQDVQDGYRDLSLAVLFQGPRNLRIIGEIQLHDLSLYNLKTKMHRLYRVNRSAHPDMLGT
ncbi:hypothetical protein GUITHDRAFT_162182 [Guillardia theta CCMP2712]|uniref:CHASE domain-containing protein n=1 Tax=Guillardia theta (strain CCMP2712) TaxID=905079 RepID=L1JML4_GUITC|nr:hypothetical protein GUITHDRAFT_162182 [Guillardia theta CCMP2712]EKX49440.1 hypothetical protein GUITHDRAFT_162182 [Guillardia theta CCMP2712]|eukprot:XP_005836420.1 hypothetical protein GUITHDRAFT_162182 [Guillardia theta CCMP2712]